MSDHPHHAHDQRFRDTIDARLEYQREDARDRVVRRARLVKATPNSRMEVDFELHATAVEALLDAVDLLARLFDD